MTKEEIMAKFGVSGDQPGEAEKPQKFVVYTATEAMRSRALQIAESKNPQTIFAGFSEIISESFDDEMAKLKPAMLNAVCFADEAFYDLIEMRYIGVGFCEAGWMRYSIGMALHGIRFGQHKAEQRRFQIVPWSSPAFSVENAVDELRVIFADTEKLYAGAKHFKMRSAKDVASDIAYIVERGIK